MKSAAVIAVLLFSTAAFAQSAGDRIAAQIGALVIQNANLADQVAAMKAQSEKDQARIKEMEDKYEPKKDAKAEPKK